MSSDEQKPVVAAKAPTMADVANRAGVSRALVSTVFRGVAGASPETRDRIMRSAAELGYRLDKRARMLRRNRTRLLGVMFRVGDAFHSDLVTAMYSAALAADYDLVLSATTPDRPEEEAMESLLDDHCEALLLISPQSREPVLERFGAQVPVISVARRARRRELDVVRTRDRHVVGLALDHLQGVGHTRICLVDGAEIHGSSDRRNSYREAMQHRGLESMADVVHGGNTEAAGQAAARLLLGRSELPTAVMAFNDRCAIGLMFELREQGVKVPEEVSVVGYDDVAMSSLPFINLTTVGQDARATAQAAVARASGRLDNGEPPGGETFVSPYFVTRSTTATPREAPVSAAIAAVPGPSVA